MDYDVYNREERYLCSHLFRPVHEALDERDSRGSSVCSGPSAPRTVSVRCVPGLRDSSHNVRMAISNFRGRRGFGGLVGFIMNLLPSNEVIEKALRKAVPLFPELAVRELVANAIIHQDFHLPGTGPMVEIFDSRMEITSPGTPLVQIDRFLDSPPCSRNELLASFMRRIGVCEERGSGIDKVVFQTEYYQLPAPSFEVTDQHTRSILYAHRPFRDMDKQDRIRACYLHACLRYVQRDFMTNTTLRKRFGFDDRNSAMASRIIKDAVEAALVRPYDSSAGRKFMKYVPFWA